MDPRDPRQPPAQPPNHPFSRNAQSPLYPRQALPPPTPSSASSTPQTVFATAAQQQQHSQHPPPPSGPAFPPDNVQRRTSDPHYFPSSRPYEPSAPSAHARHQSSSSSLTPAPSMGRPMPHTGSPSQPGQGPGPAPGGQMSGGYSLPPPRPTPISSGSSTAFPGGRDLPPLGTIARTASGGSSMSISAMLGGPSQPRDPHAPSFAPPSTSAGVSAPSYPSSTHASPRMNQSPAEYGSYRRPHTPEQHQRAYEHRDARNPGGSPHGMHHLTPEVPRYGTPQAFRPPMGPVEHSREFQRGPGGPAPPPRPSSQPKSYPPPSRQMDIGRPAHPDMYPRREEHGPAAEYNPERPIGLKYEEQRLIMSEREKFEREKFERERFEMSERDKFERESIERERFEMRERIEREREMEFRERERDRERRERGITVSDPGRSHVMHPPDYGPPGMSRRDVPPPPQYARGPDPREQAQWQQRPPYDQPRIPYEDTRAPPRQPEYGRVAEPRDPRDARDPRDPRGSVPPYGHSAGNYAQSPLDRYPPSSHPGHQQAMTHAGHPPPPLGSPDHHRSALLPPQHQQSQHRSGEDGPPPPSVAYSSGHPAVFESPRPRPMEDGPHPMAQQNFLRVQEMNRKGRISPLPQAVQGAQPQIQGPPGEAGIKSEFGRMFSGIGSGVSGLGIPSPQVSGAQLPFPNNGMSRREDLDHAPQEVSSDPKPGRDNASRNKRRKPKDDDAKGDEESNGRSTPLGGRVKRLKTHAHHHHHQYVPTPVKFVPHEAHIASHHHHHHHVPEQSSPQQTAISPFRSVKGTTPVPSPANLAKDLLMTHHHAPPRSVAHEQIRDQSARPGAGAVPSSAAVVPPKSKRIISNKAVLESVAHKPREHLGDYIYELQLKPARVQDPRTGRPPRHSYASTPKPLPMDIIRGKEGSTLMVKVGKQNLDSSSREEITSRRALWGTDIYTDDSDVVAACIHGGWIRGEWPDDIDVDMLGLDEVVDAEARDNKDKKSRGKEPIDPQPIPDYLGAPPKTGPLPVPEGRDMHVVVMVLPKLEKYTSSVRFGIKSREWGGKFGRDGQRSSHDGLSFMIKSVRFVTNGAGAQARLRGSARRERMRKAMQEVETSKVYEVRVVPNAGVGVLSLAAKKKAAGSDGDKENRSADGKQGGSPRVDAGGSKSSRAQGVDPGTGQADQGEPPHRDDDSGVGDVSDVIPAPVTSAPIVAVATTVASRLTPPADA